MILTLEGDVPSQKNNKQIAKNFQTGQRFIRSSDRVLAWKDEHAGQLAGQFNGYKVTDYPITVEITLWFGNDVRHDLDNAAATVLDMMVHDDIIDDDGNKFINRLVVNYGGIDRKNPRAEIKLED